MKRMMFVGACDKTDFLLYVCKVLAKADQKVLLVDGTQEQLYRYAVPRIDKEYQVTEFQGFDVTSGLYTHEALTQYFETQKENTGAYDLLIVDIDRPEAITKWEPIEHRVLVTTFDKKTVVRNVDLMTQLFAGLSEQAAAETLTEAAQQAAATTAESVAAETTEPSSKVRMIGRWGQADKTDKAPAEAPKENAAAPTLTRFFKVILQEVECQIDEEYIENTLSDFPILWTEPSYPIYWDDVDYTSKVENQFNGRLNMKRLSKPYKRAIMDMAMLLTGLPESDIKKALKQAERGK